ncbi:hypothetical protein FRC06_011234 [Ceratobasidium sp. 370]|nr:hypothetical protein FRC06_011234 [Ceratobasidium sp. 370]
MIFVRLRSLVGTQRAVLGVSRRTFVSLPTTCPACSKPLPTRLPICPSCSHISKLPADTPYQALFNLPENTFQIDVKDLRNRFLQTQRLMHPDAWSSKPEKEKATAAEYSSLLNKAYETLKFPLKRAEYLLSLHGVELSETDGLNEDDGSLIHEVMDLRESIESAENAEELNAVLTRNGLKKDEALTTFEQAFNEGDLVAAKKACIYLKYWTGVEESAQARLREM